METDVLALVWFGMVDGTSTVVGYLMPNQFLYM